MSAFRRHGGWRYRKRVTLPDGSSVRVEGTPAIDTKKAAEEAERAHIERVINPPKPVVERRRMSDVFDRFLADYTVIAGNKPSEVAQKKSAVELHLRPVLGKLYLDEVTSDRIDELSAELHRTPKSSRGDGMLKAKTVKNILQTLRKCLRWAMRGNAPMIQMPALDDDEIRFLEDTELEALLAKASSEPIWYAALVLGADAGLRQGEIRALHWADWNTVTGKLVIERSRWRTIDGSTKGRRSRSVPLTKRLAEALGAIKATKLRGPYVLSRQDGGAFGAEHMHDTIKRIARNAGVTEVGWHTLRHTFCTRLAMAGVPASTIQKLAGHASLATTMRYMHVVAGAEDEAIARLDSGRARGGRGISEGADVAAEAGDVIQVDFVTPKGLESKA